MNRATSNIAEADPRPDAQLEYEELRPGHWLVTCRYTILADPGRGIACSCAAGRHGRQCHHVRELMRRQREGDA